MRAVVLLPLATICNVGLVVEAIGPDGVALVVRFVIPSKPVLLTAIREVLKLPGYIVRVLGVALMVRFRSGGAFS